ncbi:MAG: VWA domain-containing protein [Bryobacteraceae bacterium]|nr:VWA domain-containing protein [Bryobacteraceae bacterium]MDW8379041.1 VWA domain-containing protein [Bryobacterales bacterium]
MTTRKVSLLLASVVLAVSGSLAEEKVKSPADQAQTGPQPKVAIEPRTKKGQEAPSPQQGRAANIRVDSTLVLIPVTVTDPLNRFVTGLDKDYFRIHEDNVEQTITQFSSEDAPLSVGLVFDASGSMSNKLGKARQAAAQFFKIANPEDEFFLVQFNDRAELMVPFTHNTEEIQNRLTFTQAKGRTALLDAVYLAIHQMKKAKNPRKAILVLSDGGDNSSRYTESEIRNLVREADVQIYAMGIFEPIASRGRTAEELSGPSLLSEIAEQTGGRHFPIENVNELPDVAAKIGIELRNQYVLGYAPTNLARDGKYRRVRVKVNQPKGYPQLRAFYRMGYYAPTQ